MSRRPSGTTGRRIAALGLLVLVIGAGLGVHLLLVDSAATDITGDALYAVAAYLAVVIVAPRIRPVIVGAIALVWCTAIELFQLTGVPIAVGAAFPPAMLVLGTVFDARDLLVYAAAVVVATTADAALGAIRGSRRRADA